MLAPDAIRALRLLAAESKRERNQMKAARGE